MYVEVNNSASIIKALICMMEIQCRKHHFLPEFLKATLGIITDAIIGVKIWCACFLFIYKKLAPNLSQSLKKI